MRAHHQNFPARSLVNGRRWWNIAHQLIQGCLEFPETRNFFVKFIQQSHGECRSMQQWTEGVKCGRVLFEIVFHEFDEIRKILILNSNENRTKEISSFFSLACSRMKFKKFNFVVDAENGKGTILNIVFGIQYISEGDVESLLSRGSIVTF